MNTPRWHPKQVIGGFEDVTEKAQARLTREQFEKVLTDHLKNQNLSDLLQTDLLAPLFRKTYNCMKQKEALAKLRPLVEGKDWRKARKTLGRVIEKELPKVLSSLKRDQNPRFPVTSALVGSLISQFEALRDDLRLTARFARSDEDLVSGYLRPQLESQFMLELDLYLRRKLPSTVTAEKRRVLIAACSIAAEFFPASAANDDIQDKIASRIYRAQRSHKHESEKWKWDEQDYLIDFTSDHHRKKRR